MVNEWRPSIVQVLKATSLDETLKPYRDLVQNRWGQMLAFTSPDASPTKLSPASKQLKTDVFATEGPLKESSFKSFKKKLGGYVQCLSNASDRLNAVQQEHTGILSILCVF